MGGNHCFCKFQLVSGTKMGGGFIYFIQIQLVPIFGYGLGWYQEYIDQPP